MLPAPRVIVVDDNPDHLRGLADGLNRYGAACLQVHFNGDVGDLRPFPHVRVIFADLHLNESGAGAEPERHFAVIGGLIEESIKPTGPYVLVLWTRFADQAIALATFLDARLSGVPKPFAVVPLDKMVHLSPEGMVKDPQALVAAIANIVTSQPQIGALLSWEERVLGAAAETVGAIIGLVNPGDADLIGSLGRLIFHLAEGAVGEGHVEADRFHAVNEALLPILADRVAALRNIEGDDPWARAFSEKDMRSALGLDDAARLNKFSHLAECAPDGGDGRGGVIELPAQYAGDNFAGTFDIQEADAAAKEFGCKDFVAGDERFLWRLVQVQASCDYAQKQRGPLPYLLALEIPAASSANNTPPQALWRSPPICMGDTNRLLRVNARFAVSITRAAATVSKAVYRLREPLLNELIYHCHVHGARPGTISFYEKKAKQSPK